MNSSYFLGAMSYLEHKIAVYDSNQESSNLIQMLHGIKPDILVLNEASVNLDLEVTAYIDKKKPKVILYGSKPEEAYGYDVFFLDPNSKTDVVGENIFVEKKLPHINALINGRYNKALASNIVTFVSENVNETLLNTLLKNYDVKVFGNKKIEHPKYLGNINPKQRADILSSTEIFVDLGTGDFFDAILCGCKTCVLSNEQSEEVKTFQDIISMTSCVNDLLNCKFNPDLEHAQKSLRIETLNKNSFTMSAHVLKQLGLDEEAEKLVLSLKEIVNDRILD